MLPGWIDTPMTDKTLHWDKFAENVLPRVPLRRWGAPKDFGGIAVYLASDASAYHTGDTLLIDGGYSKFWVNRERAPRVDVGTYSSPNHVDSLSHARQ